MKHGMHETKTYFVWRSMKARCSNPNNPYYCRYGGRGIEVCKKWNEFKGFLDDMGEKPDGLTIDRINNDKGYSKENCKWSTWKEQQRNRCSNTLLTLDGISRPVSEWAEMYGLHNNTMYGRLKRGWSHKKTILTAARRKCG